jgi:CDGSH-type Zn-finger protein
MAAETAFLAKTGGTPSAFAKPANHYGVQSTVPPDKPVLCVTVVDLEDLGKRVAANGACSLCRCYKSKAFPFCDGAHTSHNQTTGDNAGPVVVVPTGV